MSPKRAAAVLMALLLISLAPAPPGGGTAQPHQARGEPNNDFQNATEIPGEGKVFVDTLDTGDSADIYKIMLNRNGGSVEAVTALLNKTEEAGQIRVHVYDSLGYKLAWNATVGTNVVRVEASAPFPGFVFLSILIGPGSPTLEYTLNVTKTNRSPEPSLLDANNRPQEAVQAGHGFSTLTGLECVYDAADYYSIGLEVLQGGRDVLTALLAVPPSGDFALELFRAGETSPVAYSDGGDIFNPDYGTDESLHFVPSDGGAYVLRVWAERGAGEYGLSVRVFRSTADGDNELDNATELSGDGSVSGGVALNHDDSDYYRVLLRRDTTLNVTLAAEDYDPSFAVPNLNLHIYDPSRSVVNSSTASDPVEAAEHLVASTGWHYIRVSAGRNSAGNYTLSVSTIPPPEVLIPLINLTLDEDTSAFLDLSGVFKDQRSRPLTFGFDAVEGLDLSLSESVLTVAPLPNWSGRRSFGVSAANPEGKKASAEVNLTVLPVNDAPVALQTDLSFSSLEDEAFDFPMSVQALFYDVDGDALSYSADGAEGLEVAFLEDGTIRVMPLSDWWGLESFDLVATDPGGASARVSVSLNVTPVNDAPRVTWSPGNISFPEDTSTSLDLGRVFEDPDGDALEFSSAGGMALWVLIHEGTALVKSFYDDWTGTEEVIFFARDPSGATASTLVAFTAEAVPDPPQLWRRMPDQSIREDQVTTLFNLNSYFRDPDGENLSFTASGSVRVGVVVSPEGWVTFSPEANWSGTEAIRFVAEDPTGLRAFIDLNLTVEPVDDPPTLESPSVSPSRGDSGTTFRFRVVCRDIDSGSVAVSLVAGRRTIPMERVSGELASGAVYQAKATFSEGELLYYFIASDGIGSTSTESFQLYIGPRGADNTLLYIGLGITIVVVVALALAFSPPRGRGTEEEE